MKVYKIGYSFSMFADRNVCKHIKLRKSSKRYFYFEAVGKLADEKINIVGILDEEELRYRSAGTIENEKHLADMAADIKDAEKELEYVSGDDEQFLKDHIKMVKNSIRNFVYVSDILRKTEMYTYHDIFVRYRDQLNIKVSHKQAAKFLKEKKWNSLNRMILRRKMKLSGGDIFDNKKVSPVRI